MKDFETWFAPIALVASTLAAILTIFYGNRSQKREVTFTGTPLDKKEFERHQQENKEEHDRFFGRLEAMAAEAKADREKLHCRINPIEAEIASLRVASETNTARLLQIEAKIDRIFERVK